MVGVCDLSGSIMEYGRNIRRIIIKVPELNALLKITRRAALCPGFHFMLFANTCTATQ